ncbi:MAG: MOSC domain-containing protein [Chloroflexota bacterium]|nr:MOSC domain-containing protein [Chloroflexota bacterium]
MILMSVNIGEKRILQRKEHIETTGIFKFPTDKSVKVTKLGLEGDVIVSKKHHGGPDQAIYIYGAADYAWWANELGKEISPGTFGENLTIIELESAAFNVGDYIHIGEVTLQVSAPRIPCKTFAARMEDPQWVKRFRRAERPGLYCRVIREGFVEAGDSVSVENYTGDTISCLQMFRDFYDRNKSEETLLRYLSAPIAIRDRSSFEEQLQRLVTE